MENTKINPQTPNLPDLDKLCRKCLNTFPATLEFFYKSKGGKYGITPRCKTCVNEDNKIQLQKNPKAAKIKATARSKKHYHNNLEKSRERNRVAAAKIRSDPIKKAKIQARKRGGGAGLTPEQIREIYDLQNGLCAVCEEPEPTDLDHCHFSGAVRGLLCRHCNRGLGAFRDRPDLLKKAAYMLEALNAPIPAKT